MKKVFLIAVLALAFVGGCNEQASSIKLPKEWVKVYGRGAKSELQYKTAYVTQINHNKLKEIVKRVKALEAKQDPNDKENKQDG